MAGLAMLVMMQAAVTPGASPYGEAYREMIATDRPLVVMVGAEWCPACLRMRREVTPELHRRGDLDQVAFAQVDSDRQPRLAEKLMRGGSIPQLVMYYKTSLGWKTRRLVGARGVAEVERLIDEALREAPSSQVAEQSTAAKQAQAVLSE